jgi:anti-sigma factor RsiW
MSKLQISQETLYAYVDNELDAANSAKVEAAMADDPELKSLIEEQRALRALLGSAYSPVLQEPLPERVLAAARGPAAANAGKAEKPEKSQKAEKANVVRLAAARERKQAAAQEAGKPAVREWTWKHWGGMAACLAIGVLAGHSAWLANATSDVANVDGQLVARGQLSQALSTQLASAQTKDAPVKIGLSYVSKAEELCRSFTIPSAGTDGLACRRADEWALRVIEQQKPRAADAGNLRMAASPVPAAVLKVVDEQIQGSPLDADAERAAMNKGWRAK